MKIIIEGFVLFSFLLMPLMNLDGFLIVYLIVNIISCVLRLKEKHNWPLVLIVTPLSILMLILLMWSVIFISSIEMLVTLWKERK